METELINELKNYLDKKGKGYVVDSFKFNGLRENVPQIDGSTRSLFLVSYSVKINNNELDNIASYFAYFDESTKRLLYIIGPQSFFIIEDQQ